MASFGVKKSGDFFFFFLNWVYGPMGLSLNIYIYIYIILIVFLGLQSCELTNIFLGLTPPAGCTVWAQIWEREDLIAFASNYHDSMLGLC